MSDAITEKLEGLLWNPRIENLPPGTRHGVMALRFLYAVLRDIVAGNLTLRAMGLVYVTILSIVPIIAISFSILKAFGFHRQLEPILYNFLAPLGDKGIELTDQVIGFVDNIKGDVLASVGLVLLFVTAVSMAEKVEDSFNYVWRVDRPRGFGKRISEYLTLILIGPVVMVTAMALIAKFKSNALVRQVTEFESVSQTLLLVEQLAPYGLVVLGFTLIYWFLPNTRVRFRSALAGGFTGGILWAASGVLFTTFVMSSARTISIYATFAIVILALIWLYLCWLILLVGALVSFYAQNPEHLRLGYRRLSVGSRNLEQIAIGIMTQASATFRDGSPQPTIAKLAESAHLPGLMLIPVVNRLVAANLVTRTSKDQLFPFRDPGSISLSEVLSAVRDTQTIDVWSTGKWPRIVTNLSKRIDTALEQELGDTSIYALIDADATEDEEATAPPSDNS
ncbi:MAG: ribonuclease BN [Chromatiales bacterium]|nr:ribonuclease BN [Chromatiales bacterium]